MALFLTKFVDMYIENHGTPRSIRLDETDCLQGHQVKIFCRKNNNDIIESRAYNHQAIRQVERLIQKIKNRLACFKEEKLATNCFNTKHALLTIHQLQI